MDYSDLYQSPDKRYPCSPWIVSCEFTLLMRLCYNEVRRIPIEEIKIYLKQHPEEINQQNTYGCTALMIASINSNKYSSFEIVKLLLDHGADPNLQNSKGSTALMMAARYSNTQSNIETVKILLENGANPNLQDHEGCTALYFSCGNGITSDHKTVKLLLDYQANPNIYDLSRISPLIISIVENPNLETIKFLMENGAEIKNGPCIGALKFAHNTNNSKSHSDIIKLLRKRNLCQLITKHQMLKEKNRLLKKKLKEYEEGKYIMELYETIFF
jgi:ankyrin repeat protein